MTIGFSTGALAEGDFASALAMLHGKGTSAVELSALRPHEFAPLLAAVPSLDLEGFEYVAVHAPTRVQRSSEAEVIDSLTKVLPHTWNIVVHPDSIHDPAAWRPLGRRVCIENMDKRKPIGRTADELVPYFHLLPDACLCLDLAHIRQVDPSMSQAVRLIRAFHNRIAQLHISDIDASGKHLPLTTAAIHTYQQVVPLLPPDVPVIIESIIGPKLIDQELRNARFALTESVDALAAAGW